MTAARRLAAILAADVVGYSRLMGEDELARRRRCAKDTRRRRRLSPSTAAASSRRRATTSSWIFPLWSPPSNARSRSMKLMTERNAETPEDKRILYRMGMNLGDVLVEGDDIVGDGVNIAARLEGVCEPGGMYFQAPPTTMFAGVSTPPSPISARDLRNIARPVRVYAIQRS